MIKIKDKKILYTWENFDYDVKRIVKHINNLKHKYKAIYAIPCGGLVLGTTLKNYLKIPLIFSLKSVKSEDVLIVDDVSDTGNTLSKIKNIDKYYTITLFKKQKTSYTPNFYVRECKQDIWIVYPWEPEK